MSDAPIPAPAPDAGTASPAVLAAPAPRLAPPSSWAKAKGSPDWIVAGAYFAQRWERDGHGNDLSLCTEAAFDAACLAVASISIHSAPRA
jgi:hypothetical protein